MSGVLNDCDALLQGASVRILNPKDAFINLTPSAPGFHMTGAGVVDIAVVTVTADLIAIDGTVVFTAQGGTLSNATARTVDVSYANGAAVVTATVTTNGETFARSRVIPVLRDGAIGTNGTRGAGHYYATGSTWSDIVAQAACPNSSPVVNDVVTISSSTFVAEKRWTGSAWVDNGVVINGKLIVPDSILTSALATDSVTTQKLAADAVVARNIKAGEIRASHLLVGPSGALNKDPNFVDYLNSWDVTANASLAGAGGSAPATTYLGATAGKEAFTFAKEMIPIDSTKTYVLNGSVYTDPGNNKICVFMVNFYDGSGNRIASNGWGDANFSGYVKSFYPTHGDWYPYRDGVFGANSGGKTIPAAAKSCRIGVYLNAGGSSSTLMGVTALLLEEMIGSTSIQPGVIETKHLKLSQGGDISSGQTGFDQGNGFWIEGAGNGHSARMSIGNAAGAKILMDPGSPTPLRIVNPDLMLASRVGSISSSPGDAFSHWRAVSSGYCGSHTAGISNPVNPSYAWSISDNAVQANFSLGSTTSAQAVVYVTATGAAAGDEVECMITCAISDGGTTVVVSKILYVTFT